MHLLSGVFVSSNHHWSCPTDGGYNGIERTEQQRDCVQVCAWAHSAQISDIEPFLRTNSEDNGRGVVDNDRHFAHLKMTNTGWSGVHFVCTL